MFCTAYVYKHLTLSCYCGIKLGKFLYYVIFVSQNCNLYVLQLFIQGVPGGMCQTSGECSLC